MDTLIGLDKSCQPPSSTPFHSTDPRWRSNNHGKKLLAFLEMRILDLGRNHPSVTEKDVAGWVGSMAAGSPEIEKLKELHVWQRKAVLAKDFLQKFPDCTPAKQFLARFKEKLGYELGL